MLLDELGLYLHNAGIGALGTTLVRGPLPLETPGSPDALTALIEVPGMAPTRSHDGTTYEQPVVQVLTRGNPHAYEATRMQAQQAWDALDGLSNQVLSGVLYLWIQALQSPWWLKTDDSWRPCIVFSIRVARAL